MDCNNNYDVCYYHSNETLKYVCLSCNSIPICSDCLIYGELHNGHKVVKYNTDHIIDMKYSFKKNLYLEVDQLINENKVIIYKCQNIVEQLETEMNKNLKFIKDQIKTIHHSIQMIERDLENQIKENHENNKNIESSLLSITTNQNTIDQ